MSLPLVFDLTDRLVVAVGGGPVSARRVRAFLDEGARVQVIAPWLCEDLIDFVHAEQIDWVARDYAGPLDLTDAWLVHTATGDSATDHAVSQDAHAARIWCIDATSAKHTAAAVPARSTVNTPDGKVTVATHVGGDPRTAVTAATAVAQVVEDALSDGRIPLQRNRARSSGWVALVGGGPGNDELLTRRAHELIASADVVVIDRLAPWGVVSRLPETVRVINVGKTPGHHPIPQNQINEILVDEAQRGHGVVRLKGGDPYVLGRGSEERQFCENNHVSVEVVPGVTSAIAVPAAAGIPLTHRGLARGFTVVTGHDELPALPVGRDHTLVLLMGVAGLRRSAEVLMSHGRDPECPVAIVERGFQPTQRTTIGTLTTIADLAAARDVQAPAVVVIGDVVRLANEPTPGLD
ncbi:uroporphyrinogen-III C-methyltransferase [Demetria terragena]|uniref:uroporphyrinogen-III C-methyltransferase n=1 Tax=Demetria terragena TaxID=63959 RepID=UPI00035E3447|nr:uroporphyrinogen-III C-methyltransferase [Demetria terragena]